MPALAEIRPRPETGLKERERSYARRAVSHILLGVTSVNLSRFHPDNTSPLTPHEKQTIASAKPDTLNDAFTLAEAVSLESRRKAHSDTNTWVTRMTRWTDYQLAKQDTHHEERINALQAVGLLNAAHEVTANMFYDNYFYDRQTGKPKSDIQQFVRDIADGCIENGAVNMRKLEHRLASVQGLLTAFGKTNRVDLMIQDFATSYGILSQPDTKRQQFINDVANTIAHPLPHNAQERVYLATLANIQQLDILPQDASEEEMIPLVLTQEPDDSVKRGKKFVAYYEEDPNGQGYRPVEHDMKRNLIYKELGRGTSRKDLLLLAAGFSTQHLRLIDAVERSLGKLTPEQRTELVTGAAQDNPLAAMSRFTYQIFDQAYQGKLSDEQVASILTSASYILPERPERGRQRSQQKLLRKIHENDQKVEPLIRPFRLPPGEQPPHEFLHPGEKKDGGVVVRHVKNEQNGGYETEYAPSFYWLLKRSPNMAEKRLREVGVSFEDMQRLNAAEKIKKISFTDRLAIAERVKGNFDTAVDAVRNFLRSKGFTDQQIDELDTTSPLLSRPKQRRAIRTQRRLTPESQTPFTPVPEQTSKQTTTEKIRTEVRDFGYGYIAGETGKGMVKGFADGLLKGDLAKRLIPIPHVRLGLAVLGAITGGLSRGERAAQQKIGERRERVRNGQQ
ncbi:MAG TPA: hypothetical protein VLF20_02295 [Patescibacteria group bacterium]|nr:hypothetical protein [Patescibacteria group bacterium]